MNDSSVPHNGHKESPSKNSGLPLMSPDIIEEEFPDTIDNVIPTRGYEMIPMVGLGGSAGGITALGHFFEAMPSDSGMVFVVILHLSPTHESNLPQVLSHKTSMPVLVAVDNQKVEPNHVYVIPPGKVLATVDGHLRLREIPNLHGKRLTVDLFFRSLADTHGPHAAAVVLSGADGDGALGIKRIKERGGLTIVQDPDEAEHRGMPNSAIETGMVDWVLKVAKIPQRLIDYSNQEERLKLPAEEGPAATHSLAAKMDENEAAFRELLTFLRTRTGRDFLYYKRATIVRRIARRMQVNTVDNMVEYLAFLRTHPGEPVALLQDLLISVTNFFRDRDSFEALAKYLPELIRNKSSSEAIRVWVPACATGEEAYSLAILLIEATRDIEGAPAIQIFACDLNEEAIQSARAGLYPHSIEADVSEERLRRFFVRDHNGYRIRRELREMILFATHDLLKDAPFSRMDLISCRNLLIYLNRAAQSNVFGTFNFALKPEGRLFLGSSEAIDDGNFFFQVVDKKHRIYAPKATARTALLQPASPGSLLRVIHAQDLPRSVPAVHGINFSQESAISYFPLKGNLDRASRAELHFRLLERFAPPSVIVNSDHEIIHLSEHAGRYLQISGGDPSMNLLRTVLPALRGELRAGLFRAAETNSRVESQNIAVEIDGKRCVVDISVCPASELASGFLLVLFHQHEDVLHTTQASEYVALVPEPVVSHLERALEKAKSDLRDTVEQYEASTEELKASNEELQAMNEELRSATEELETSREELQSINEELTTVNQEMKMKVDELDHTNSDLQNLMASTAIATVFLDRDLRIMRFTPTATEIFHLIPGDIGRPLAHLQHNLQYPQFITEAEGVLRTLVPVEREIRDDTRWFIVRLRPYRTTEDHIAGLVITMVDITERKQSVEALRESEERLRFNTVAVGRESRMIELKKEVNALRSRLGEPPVYAQITESENGETA